MTKLRCAAVLGVVLASVPGQETTPQHLLRLLFTDDGPTWFRVQQDMTARMNLSGTTKIHGVRMDMFWKTRIERSDTAIVVVHTLARFRAASGDDGGYVYDSATESNAPAGIGEIASVIDAEIRLTIDSRGRVKKLELPQGLKEMDERSGLEFMSASDMIRPLDLELPELPVAVGARWRGSNERSLETSDKFAFESEYELVAVEKGKARIAQRFVMKAAEDGTEGAGDEKDREPDDERPLGRRATRTFTLDLSTGRVVRVEEEATIEAAPLGQAEIRLSYTSKRTAYASVEPARDLEPLKPPAPAEKKK